MQSLFRFKIDLHVAAFPAMEEQVPRAFVGHLLYASSLPGLGSLGALEELELQGD